MFFIFPKFRKKSIKLILWRCLYVFQHMTEPTLRSGIALPKEAFITISLFRRACRIILSSHNWTNDWLNIITASLKLFLVFFSEIQIIKLTFQWCFTIPFLTQNQESEFIWGQCYSTIVII